MVHNAAIGRLQQIGADVQKVVQDAQEPAPYSCGSYPTGVRATSAALWLDRQHDGHYTRKGSGPDDWRVICASDACRPNPPPDPGRPSE